MVQTLKASSSMPFISAPTPTKQGLCLDGGITDSIPYAYAQLSGYDKIVVIRTREREYRKSRTQSPLRYAYEHAFAKYPDFVKAAAARPEMYNRQADQLDELEAAGKVFVIAPNDPVTVGRLEPDTSKLEALYETGLTQTNALIPELQLYLQ
jgi:predicted patatin/cPLA2 family phospholipase